MRTAIVADDLTGALDACAPFAAKGLRCRVATRPEGLAKALGTEVDVVCANTATREVSSEIAEAVVSKVALQLAASKPDIAFKKIDSRLQGHVVAEVRACLAAFGRRRAIVAPAVPLQGRQVIANHVVGTGLPEPLAIAATIGDAIPHEAPDCRDARDLEHVARFGWDDVLFVGASGLAAGFAEVLASGTRKLAPPINGPMLIVVGSHDPITLEQVHRAAGLQGVRHFVTDDGDLPSLSGHHPVALVQASVGTNDRPRAMAKFGAAIATLLQSIRFRSVLLSGGETAQTVLAALGVDTLDVLGEVLPGIPVTEARIGDHALAILTKSGGFGTPDDILWLAQAALQNMRPTHFSVAGEQA